MLVWIFSKDTFSSHGDATQNKNDEDGWILNELVGSDMY